MCQISVRARVVLSHAIFAKVMRMREGGGAEASEDGESNQEDDDGSVAGDTDTATTGRVNSAPVASFAVIMSPTSHRPRRDRYRCHYCESRDLASAACDTRQDCRLACLPLCPTRLEVCLLVSLTDARP